MARFLQIVRIMAVFQICTFYGLIIGASSDTITYATITLVVLMTLAPSNYSL